MENNLGSLQIKSKQLVFSQKNKQLSFMIKNKSLKTVSYEISVKDHFQLVFPRIFCLAPGIAKQIRINHHPSSACSEDAHHLTITTSLQQKAIIPCFCSKYQEKKDELIDIPKVLEIGEIGEGKTIYLPIENISNSSLKIMVESLPHLHLDVQVGKNEYILLNGKKVEASVMIKAKQNGEFHLKINVSAQKEESSEEQHYQILINGSSFQKKQYLANQEGVKLHSLSVDMVNGSHVTGFFYIHNQHHKPAHFKLIPHIRATHPKNFAIRWKEHSIAFMEDSGIVESFSKTLVKYRIQAHLSDDDQKFVERFSHIPLNDEMGSFKIKNSGLFKKNSDLEVEVVFDQVEVQRVLIKCTIINCAIRFGRQELEERRTMKLSKSSTLLASNNKSIYYEQCQQIIIQNDSNIQIPFSISPNSLFKVIPEKGILKHKDKNHFELNWKSNRRCRIILQLPQIEIQLHHNPGTTKRPFTPSRLTSQSRPLSSQKIHRKPIIVEEKHFSVLKPLENRISVSNKQLEYLDVEKQEGFNIFRNRHPQKQMHIRFQNKGYLTLKSTHTYKIKEETYPLIFTVNQQPFTLEKGPNLDSEENQEYKIGPKELVFSFSSEQKECEVVRGVSILNKKNVPIKVYCLTSDNLYFTSKEKDNKIVVEPNCTMQYKFSFCPKITCSTKEQKVCQEVELSVNGKTEKVNLVGELLQLQYDYHPKSIKFENCHFGEEETMAQLTITNTCYHKLWFQFENHELLTVRPQSGFTNPKSHQICEIYFTPSKHLNNYQTELRAYIRGSHVMHIPVFINTLEPSVRIMEEVLDFGLGIVNEQLFSTLTLANEDNSYCQVALDFSQTPLYLKEQSHLGTQKTIIALAPHSKVTIQIKVLIASEGKNRIDLKNCIAELVGYGPIPSPRKVKYFGRQSLIAIVPSDGFHSIILSQVNENYEFKIRSLSHSTLSISIRVKSNESLILNQGLIISCTPESSELLPGEVLQASIDFIVTDLEKVKERATDHTLVIYINQQLYTQIQFKVHMPTPCLQFSPPSILFPTVALRTFSNTSFKIINKGYKEITVKIIKPPNIMFQLQTSTNSACLTRLKNQFEVNLLFQSKKKVSFQTNLEVWDNFNNKYIISMSGTATDSPFFLPNHVPALPYSSRSFSSVNSFSGASQQIYEDTEDVQFVNKWLHSLLPTLRSESKSFPLWLSDPQNLKSLLLQFGVTLPPKLSTLQAILEQLKTKGYQLCSLNPRTLEKGQPTPWLHFMWNFLSLKFIHPSCLKWLSKVSSANYDSYETVLNNFRKIMVDIWNRMLEGVFTSRIKQWNRLCEKLHPYMGLWSEVNNRKQSIIIVNQLYHKLSEPNKQIIQSTDLNISINVENVNSARNLNYWVLVSKDCQISDIQKRFELAKGDSIVLKFSIRGHSEVMIFNDSLFEPIHIYQIVLKEKSPLIHNVSIQCEDKCTQQWSLDYISAVESNYLVEFVGDTQFRIKVPPVGILKQSEILPIRVFYSPNNLKLHRAKLTISSKYIKEIYQISGKPLCSHIVELQKSITITQGERSKQVIQLPWEIGTSTAHKPSQRVISNFKLIEYNGHFEELVAHQIQVSKINRKELKLTLQYNFEKIYRNLELMYQILSEDQNSKIIRIIVDVIPKPINIEAKVKCIVGEVVKEKIPVQNTQTTKQIVRVEVTAQSSNQFKMDRKCCIKLQPEEVSFFNLIYRPETLQQSSIQIRVLYEESGQVMNFEFMGQPQFPTFIRDLIHINCEVEEPTKQYVKVENILNEKVSFDVETDLSEISGKTSISLYPKQIINYEFTVLALHPGNRSGRLKLCNKKMAMQYKINITATNNLHKKVLKVQGKIREASIIEIQLQNKSDKDITYEISCSNKYIEGPKSITIQRKSRNVLKMVHLPILSGKSKSELKLYNKDLPQIHYELNIQTQPHSQTPPVVIGQLGMPMSSKILLKNPTNSLANIYINEIPKTLTFKPLPIEILPKSQTTVDVQFSPTHLEPDYQYVVDLQSNIGPFQYSFNYILRPEKQVQTIDVFYQENEPIECQIKHTHHYADDIMLKLQSDNQYVVFHDQFLDMHGYTEKTFKFLIKKINLQNLLFSITLRDTKLGFVWIYRIKLIKLEKIAAKIQIRGTAQIMTTTKLRNFPLKGIDKFQVSGLPNDFFNLSCRGIDHYLQVIINRRFSYEGSITFFNEHLAAEYPLNIQIMQPKFEHLVICANVGEKSSMVLNVTNGHGYFNVKLSNNKGQEFSVQPLNGNFDEDGRATITISYHPSQYSGIKRSKIIVSSETMCQYFQVLGKFPK